MVSSSPVKSSKFDFKNFFQSKQDKTTGNKTFAASAFSKNIRAKESFASQLKKIADAVPERKENVVGGSVRINDQLKEVNENLLSINSSIKDITDILVKERKQDLKNLKDKRRKYKRLAGKRQAEKKENVLEGTGKGIVNALKKPFRAINRALGNPLDKIKNALLMLGIGWLTDKFIKLFQADRDGEKARFDELVGEISKGLLAMGGIALALGGGLTALITTLGGLALKVGAWIATRPFVWLYRLGKFVVNRLKDLLNIKSPQPKPPTTTGAKPNPGVTPRPGGTNPRLTPGGTTPDGNVRGTKPKGPSGAGRSTFQLEQSRKAATQAASAAPTKQGGIFGQINRFLKGLFAKFETTNIGRGLGRIVTNIKGNALYRFGGKFILDPIVKGFEWTKSMLSARGMARNLGKVLKFAGPIITALMSFGSIQSRASKGMTPAQAIMPELLRVALAAGGAALGASAGVGWLSVPFALAGSFAGDWLGGQIMNWADAPEQAGIWKSSLFDGFNNGIRELSLSNEMIGSLFPYDTGLEGVGSLTDKMFGVEKPAAPAAPAAPRMMSENDFYNTQVEAQNDSDANARLLGASNYEEYKANFATANPSAAPQVEQSQVNSQLNSRSETNIADAVTPSGPGASRQRAETVNQSGFTEGQQVTVDVAQVTAAGQKQTSNNGQTASAPPALSASDLSNPYRLLSRSIYNVVVA